MSRDDVVFVNPVVMIEILLHFYVHCHTGVITRTVQKRLQVRGRKIKYEEGIEMQEDHVCLPARDEN